MTNDQHRDEYLWQMARARVAFRWSLACYVIVNAVLTAIWFFSGAHYFWPVWPMLGWGVGLAFQYFHAYHGNQFANAVREYEKLKEEEENSTHS